MPGVSCAIAPAPIFFKAEPCGSWSRGLSPTRSAPRRRLRARGHEAIVASLLPIEVSFDADLGPGPWSAVLITSANAVHAVSGHARFAELQAAPVFAVGRRSAEAARAAGFADVTSADGDVADLARLVRARVAASARVLYLAGEERSGDLAGDLAEFEMRTVAIYRAVGAASLAARRA